MEPFQSPASSLGGLFSTTSVLSKSNRIHNMLIPFRVFATTQNHPTCSSSGSALAWKSSGRFTAHMSADSGQIKQTQNTCLLLPQVSTTIRISNKCHSRQLSMSMLLHKVHQVSINSYHQRALQATNEHFNCGRNQFKNNLITAIFS